MGHRFDEQSGWQGIGGHLADGEGLVLGFDEDPDLEQDADYRFVDEQTHVVGAANQRAAFAGADLQEAAYQTLCQLLAPGGIPGVVMSQVDPRCPVPQMARRLKGLGANDIIGERVLLAQAVVEGVTDGRGAVSGKPGDAGRGNGIIPKVCMALA